MTEDSGDSEMLRDLQRETAKLPREITPPDEAWKKIKAQIDMEAQLVAMMPMHSRERAFWQRPAFLAAAGLLLVAGASLMTALMLGKRIIANTRESGGGQAPAAPADRHSRSSPRGRKTTYGTEQLSEIIESGKTELTPETIAKLKRESEHDRWCNRRSATSTRCGSWKQDTDRDAVRRRTTRRWICCADVCDGRKLMLRRALLVISARICDRRRRGPDEVESRATARCYRRCADSRISLAA